MKELIESQNWQKAFSKARKYFFGLTPEQKRDIEIASDCYTGKQSFYERLGVNTAEATERAKQFLTQKFAA